MSAAVDLLNAPAQVAGPGTWRRLLRNPQVVVAGGVLGILIVVAAFGPFLLPYRYDQQELALDKVLAAPSPQHWLGTDPLGRDVLTRIIYGARASLAIGIIVVLLDVAIGTALGLIAGYKGGRWDTFLMRVTDMMFAFPDILLAILIMAMMGRNVFNIFIALGIVSWPPMTRLVRGEVLALREREFIEAARAIGVPDRRIMMRHLLPNLFSPIMVAATVSIGGIILAESTLSFLGIGIQPPYPSWGTMINEGREYLRTNPALVLYPSIVLAVTVLAFNFLGDGVRDVLDPRLKGIGGK